MISGTALCNIRLTSWLRDGRQYMHIPRHQKYAQNTMKRPSHKKFPPPALPFAEITFAQAGNEMVTSLGLRLVMKNHFMYVRILILKYMHEHHVLG